MTRLSLSDYHRLWCTTDVTFTYYFIHVKKMPILFQVLQPAWPPGCCRSQRAGEEHFKSVDQQLKMSQSTEFIKIGPFQGYYFFNLFFLMLHIFVSWLLLSFLKNLVCHHELFEILQTYHLLVDISKIFFFIAYSKFESRAERVAK